MDHWARVAKWGLLGATYVMNTWESYAAGNLAGIVLHSVPVLAVFVGAEAVTSCNDALTRSAEVALTKATERAELKARENREQQITEAHGGVHPATGGGRVRAGWAPRADSSSQSQGGGPEDLISSAETTSAAPFWSAIPPGRETFPKHSAPVWQAVQARPEPAPADRSGPARPDRSADRSATPARTGPARKRTGKPRTDADLSRAVRELAEQNGGTPPRSTARATLRAGVTIGQSVGSWVRRGYDAATLGVYRRQITAAEAMGDHHRLAAPAPEIPVITQLLSATTSAVPDLPGWVTLAVLGWVGWRQLLCWWFPFAPCRRCDGSGKRRSGKYWRPCRRCKGTGRKTRLGHRIWDWTRSSEHSAH
jgi:hypothetical protein